MRKIIINFIICFWSGVVMLSPCFGQEKLEVTGIMNGDFAIVNGEVVTKGDKSRGFTVKEINADSVVFVLDSGELIEKKLEEKKESTDKKTPPPKPPSLALEKKTNASSQDSPGNNLFILKEGYPIAVSKEALSAAMDAMIAKDQATFQKLTASQVVGITKSGIQVYLVKEYWGVAEVTPKGEKGSLFTPVEALGK